MLVLQVAGDVRSTTGKAGGYVTFPCTGGWIGDIAAVPGHVPR